MKPIHKPAKIATIAIGTDAFRANAMTPKKNPEAAPASTDPLIS